MLSNRRNLLMISAGFVLLFVLAVIGHHAYLTHPYPGHNDFMSRWEGARSYWVDGLNPYGDEASLNIQVRIYGQAATEDQDPGYFAYPFYTAFIVGPLVFTSYAWASAIWMVFLEVALIVALVMLFDLFRWQPRPVVLGALVLFAVLAYYPARGLILGQPGLLVYALEVMAIWALARRLDVAAGVVLAVSTLKPQMGYLIVPFLLLWGLRVYRWRFVGSFSLTFSALMLASFVLVPTWLTDWLGQVSIYTSYTALGGPIWIVANYPWFATDPDTGLFIVEGGFGTYIEWVITGGLYLYMLVLWYDVLIQNKRERFLWTVVLTLVLTHLVAPRTATPHYVVFMIPLIYYLREIATRFYRRGATWYILTSLSLLFIVPWVHFVTTVIGEFEHPTVYLPIPFLTIIILILTRRRWWNDETDRFQQHKLPSEAA